MEIPNLFSYHAMNVNPYLLIYIGPGSTTLYCFISLHHLHLVGLVCWFQSKNNAVAQTTLLGLTHDNSLVNHLWRLIENYWTRSKVSSLKHPSFSWANSGGSFQYPCFPINSLLDSLSCQYPQSIPSLKRHKRKPPCNTWNKTKYLFQKYIAWFHIP